MDYFKKFVTSDQENKESDGSETVNKLCERARTSTLLDDRRGAVRALKSLSRGKFRLQVATQAMELLMSTLEHDRSDAEIVGFALDALVNILTDEFNEDESHLPADIGEQFTEILIKVPENMTIMLSMLDEYDFHVRWPAVKLITILLRNKPKPVQEQILTSPQGVPKLMDLLSDSREFVRNDALLLLTQLTKSNANIQKIVAFENAFERLLEVVADEGYSDGGVVVEDCLNLLLNLLQDNKSNQTLFTEGNYVRRLTMFFEIDAANSEQGWSAQKVANMHCMLQTVRALVSPNSPQKDRGVCQRLMNQCGLLQKLCSILMATGIPAEVLTGCINTVAEVIRGHADNQNFFASVMAPSNPPQPAIVVLLMSMVNDKQPFVLRCAVLYCFECFLYKNDLGQSQIIATLLPTTAEVNQITAGQLLCTGLFSHDALSTWFASVALLHTVLGKTQNKENLLRVQLATSVGNPPVTLLQQCMNILTQGSPLLQTKLGLLMFLNTWLANCPTVTSSFLSNPSNVSYLTSQVSSHDSDESELIVQGLCAFLLGLCVEYNKEDVENYDKASLKSIIDKRVGFEVYADRLSQVSKHECYTLAAKKPYVVGRHPDDVYFDHEFTKLYKSLEVQLASSVCQDDAANKEQVANHDGIVMQYKEFIRVQDLELAQLKDQIKSQEEMSTELENLKQQVQQLQEQNTMLNTEKSQLMTDKIQANGHDSDFPKTEILQTQNEEVQRKLEDKEQEITQLNQQVSSLTQQLQTVELQQTTGTPEPDVKAQLESRMSALDNDLSQTKSSLEAMQKSSTEKDSVIQQLRTEINETNAKLAEKDKKIAEINEEMKEKETDGEELLLLLETNSDKLKSLKARLRDLGQEVSEDEEDDEDDEEDIDDES